MPAPMAPTRGTPAVLAACDRQFSTDIVHRINDIITRFKRKRCYIIFLLSAGEP